MDTQHPDQNENDTPEVSIVDGLREVHRSQGTSGSLTLLLVTIVLFFSSGIISATWQEVLILIGVLLFHELGHFVAMKLLKYDDVKMFFIPFVGAAVSGRAKKETALKSCIVTLMGPFPGIVVGAFLYFLFAWTNKYYLLKTSEVMLLLNAFNLLPIMPLDGGRFLDVLFVRRRVFRLLFALFGAAVFLWLAVVVEDIVLGVIGVFSVIAAFAGFKAQGLANAIESDGAGIVSIDGLLDDRERLAQVIAQMRSRYPSLFEPQIVYRSIYSNLTVIVDTLKFIPAGIVAKLSLLMAYPVLLLVAVAVTFFFVAVGFNEQVAYEDSDNGRVTYAERYMFGHVRSRIPIDESKLYHGMGTAFVADSTATVTDIFWYDKGYRTGTWVTKNAEGDTTEIETYEKGRLLSVLRRTPNSWDTLSPRDLPFLRRTIAAIREVSQPLRSNHEHFSDE